jgi:prokaryotic ubiquitin-like protein Pup
MSEQEQVRKQRTERKADEATEESVDATKADQIKGDQIKADLDDLLDEIDEVLEDNAEEFVRNYIQKGGE